MHLIKNKSYNNNIRIPLIFETEYYKKNKIINLRDIEERSYCTFSYFKTLIDDVLVRRNRNIVWDGKTYRLYFSHGFIIYNTLFDIIENYNFVTIVYRNKKTGEIEAWINKEYIDYLPSHKTLINKFIKGYGVKHRKNVHYVLQKDFDAFIGKINISKDDYTDENQLKITKNFLTYISNVPDKK